MSTPGERWLAARVPGQPVGAVRREAVVEPLEVAAVDLAAVLKAEQALAGLNHTPSGSSPAV